MCLKPEDSHREQRVNAHLGLNALMLERGVSQQNDNSSENQGLLVRHTGFTPTNQPSLTRPT
jgi:hypothetical protein